MHLKWKLYELTKFNLITFNQYKYELIKIYDTILSDFDD